MFAWKPPASNIGVLKISVGIYVVVVGVMSLRVDTMLAKSQPILMKFAQTPVL